MKPFIITVFVGLITAALPLFASSSATKDKDLLLIPYNILPDVDLRLDLHVRQTRKGAFSYELDEDLTVKFNEFVTFSYGASQDGFVSLWSIGSSGKLMRLLPNKFKTSTKVKAGEIYHLGEKSQKFAIQINGPEGMEEVFLLWTKNEADQPMNLDNSVNTSAIYDLEDILSVTNVDHKRWASKRLSFDVSASGEVLVDDFNDLNKRAARSLKMTGITGNVYVLSMGANTGKLRKAGLDAKNFHRAMKSLIPKNIQTRLYPDAHVSDFRSGMDWLKRNAEPNDTVIIYYSGHGSTLRDQDEDETTDRFDEVFVMADARGVLAPGEAHIIRDDEFAQRANRLRTNKVIVVLDACFSAGLTKNGLSSAQGRRKFFSAGSLGTYVAAFKTNFHGDRQSVNKGVLISAAAENQSAYEGAKGGVMTAHLISEILSLKNKGRSLYSLVNQVSKSVGKKTNAKPGMSGDLSLLKRMFLAER